jgi:hypothetical protein
LSGEGKRGRINAGVITDLIDFMSNFMSIAQLYLWTYKTRVIPSVSYLLMPPHKRSVEAIANPVIGQAQAGSRRSEEKNGWWVESHQIQRIEVNGPFPLAISSSSTSCTS